MDKNEEKVRDQIRKSIEIDEGRTSIVETRKGEEIGQKMVEGVWDKLTGNR